MHRSKVGLLSLSVSLAVGVLVNTCSANLNDELFGRGLTAFHNGQMEQAVEIFSELIDDKTTDPRPYYFRGLVFLRSGRPEQAEADFNAGAQLEANNNIRTYPINKSLQFVQGADRLKLEQFRTDAQRKRKEMRQKVLELRYATGDAKPLPEASAFQRPEVTEIADATLPSLTLAPLEIDQITVADLNDLPPIAATVDILTKASSAVPMPELNNKIDAQGVKVGTGSVASGGSDPFASGTGSSGASTDPFATGKSSSGASDPFSTGGGNKAADPFSTGGGSGDKSKGSGNTKDPFGG